MSNHADLELDAATYLHGNPDQATVARLSAALRQDPALRATFIRLARLHGHLGEIGQRTALGQVESARLLSVHQPRPQVVPVRVQPRRRWGGWIGAAAALLAVGFSILALGLLSHRTRLLVPTVTVSQGCVIQAAHGQENPLSPGLHLRVGDRITAIGMDSHATVTLQGGRFTLGPASRVVIVQGDALKRYIRLESGSLEADLSAAEVPLYIQAGAASVRINDAQTTVRLEPGLTRIVVARGQVAVNSGGGDLTLEAGRTLDVPRRPESEVVSTLRQHARATTQDTEL